MNLKNKKLMLGLTLFAGLAFSAGRASGFENSGNPDCPSLNTTLKRVPAGLPVVDAEKRALKPVPVPIDPSNIKPPALDLTPGVTDTTVPIKSTP